MNKTQVILLWISTNNAAHAVSGLPAMSRALVSNIIQINMCSENIEIIYVLPVDQFL